MEKKNGIMSNLYLIGMALVVIGFILPMFKVLGQTPNGFKFINFKNSGFCTIGSLMIIASGIAGLVFNFVSNGSKTLKLAALAVSIIGAIVLIIGFNDNVVYKAIGKGLVKHAYVGFYCTIVGWVAGILGYLKA